MSGSIFCMAASTWEIFNFKMECGMGKKLKFSNSMTHIFFVFVNTKNGNSKYDCKIT